ncbi:MAG: HEAT repeat domain-containing protein [Christensenellales bacterium]
MNFHKRSNGKNRDSYGSSVAHKALTKEVVAQRLALPNGPEHMMHYVSEAFPFAYELFSEGNSAACAFLCRCAKQEKYARQLNDIMGSEREALRNALLSNQPKLRKNAAVLMGQLKVPSDVKYLKQALSVEDTRFVRPSMLLSLGSIGGDETKAALASYTIQPANSGERHFEADTEADKSAMRSFLTFEKHEFTARPRPCEIELRSPDKLSDPLARELAEHGFRVSAVHRGDVHVHTEDMMGLFACRCFTEALIEISANSNPDPKSMGIKAKSFLEKLLPACHTGKPPFGYRLEIRGEGNIDRLAIARRMIAVMDGETLLNCPNNYEVEIRVEIGGNGGAFMYAKLLTIKDERFSYRVSALPASMHPATAAAILKGGIFLGGKDARCWTPAAAAAFLIEREKLTPCRSYRG